MSTRRYIVEGTQEPIGKGGKRWRTKRTERPFTEAQSRIWDEMCNSLTTDEATRLAMLDAALRARQEAMDRLLGSIDISEEGRAAIREAMDARRKLVVSELVQG